MIYPGLIFDYNGKKVEVVKIDFYGAIVICKVINSTSIELMDLDREEVLKRI